MLRLAPGLIGEDRLARLAARGERRAFEAVFARYHREIYHYCRAILGEPEEAQDALQNTMAVALRHLPNAERRTSLRGWLYRVAHNEAISIVRRRPVPLDPHRLPEGLAPGADARFEERERLRQLVADLRELPDRQRAALVMRELSGLSYSDIATATGTSDAAARQLVYEARESLRAAESGRELDCESARRAISERDGRMFRGRRLRAHLRACASCRDFKAAIESRRADLAVLFLPLAPAAASGMLASLLGGFGKGSATSAPASAGAAAVGGGGGAALGGLGVKAASIASVLVVGAGAAGISGGIQTPFSGGGDRAAAAPAAGVRPAPASAATAHRAAAHAESKAKPAGAGSESSDTAPPGRRGMGNGGSANGSNPSPSPGSPPAHANSGGAPATAGGPPATTPGASHANGTAQPGNPASSGSPSPPVDRGIVRDVPHGAPRLFSRGAGPTEPARPQSQLREEISN